MSSPFSPIAVIGQSIWSIVLPNAGNFTPIDIPMGNIPEIGYGQGGFGIGGYDTPTVNSSGGLPVWITGSLK